LANLNTYAMVMAHLAADAPELARSLLADTRGPWFERGFQVQHHYAVVAQALIDLYAGQAKGALKCVEQHWGRYESSQLMRTQQVRGEMLHLRGRCRLAAGGRKSVAAALRDVKALEREPAPWLGALATLLKAACAAASGDNRNALTLLRTAVDQLDATD